MLDRVAHGEIPAKPHTQLRSASGALRYEECFTREGFETGLTAAWLDDQRRPRRCRRGLFGASGQKECQREREAVTRLQVGQHDRYLNIEPTGTLSLSNPLVQ